MTNKVDLEYEAARLKLGLLSADQIREIVERLYSENIYSDQMLEITDNDQLSIQEASKIFEKVLNQNDPHVYVKYKEYQYRF